MAGPAPGTVVLFVAGDPDLGEGLPTRFVPGFWRFFIPQRLFRDAPPVPRPTAADLPLPLPPVQLMCAQRLLDAAKKAGRTVRFVDVNSPGANRDLVERYVGAGDILPVLVRADGARLEGEEAFRPGPLKRFLSAS